MLSPFPGMNPYLEHPDLWPGVHHCLIIEIARFLSPQLRPKYIVAVEVRMYETTDEDSLLVGLPDVAIELLSPVNKRSGKGREAYEEKRQKVLGSSTSLVEIDLLKSGQPMQFFSNQIQSQYRILVCRGNRRPLAELGYCENLSTE